MSFEEMWGKARTDAVVRQRSSVELNQLPAEGGAGGGSKSQLKVNSSVLAERAKNAETVRTNFKDADDRAMAATGRIQLKGFRSEAAITTFQKRWRSQMKYMDEILEKGVAGNLRLSAADYKAQEEKRRRAAEKLHDGKTDS